MTPPPTITIVDLPDRFVMMDGLWMRQWSLEQSAEEDFIDAAAEANLAVDHDNRYAGMELVAEARFLVDIDESWTQAVAHQQIVRFIAEVAAVAGVEFE